MALHIDMLSAKKPFGSFNGKIFGDIHKFAAAVIPFAGITFGVFIGQMGTRDKHNIGGHEIFACDKLYIVFLPFKLFYQPSYISGSSLFMGVKSIINLPHFLNIFNYNYHGKNFNKNTYLFAKRNELSQKFLPISYL